ncbi:MAG: AMP-binding protein, partial [Candidatus Binatia bacterium]
LTYTRLWSHAAEVVRRLNSLGVGRNDRVALVLPNGPEAAAAFLAVACCAAAAPLNPAYRANEFDFYLSDLNAKALIVQAGIDSPARAVAQKRSIPIIELSPAAEDTAGLFTLRGEGKPCESHCGFAEPQDIALILHTSGTTARPKRVPLTHANLLASAANIAAVLRLGENDRCLNVMPLFHIHGLIGAVLSSIRAGAGVVCTPGFHAPQFSDYLEEFRPTWYTAVPTMHQAIVARFKEDGEALARSSLRFIRSSSAPLPPKVMADLEDLFQVPVVEAYGMTEASHQIASNPLPPHERKAGSVGLPTGTRVGIMDESGKLLPRGEAGEIVLRGANLTRGYENDGGASGTAFLRGWLRTGDLGHFDKDGYLFITGRIKEIINRGGEKVAPSEVEQVLTDHPFVAQAVTFGIPHTKLGEDVAAAVVLHENASATEREIQEFAALRLAEYKIPRRVVFVDEIPKNAAGKLQRLGLAEKLGLTVSDQTQADRKGEFIAPRTPDEEKLAKIWAQVLRVEAVGIHDNFFDLGGDSI